MDLSKIKAKFPAFREKYIYSNCPSQDPDTIANSLILNPKDLELIRLAFNEGDKELKALAACWLSYIGDQEALREVTGNLERALEDSELFCVIPMIWMDYIPPLSTFEPFVKLVIDNLDPSHQSWKNLLQISGIQKIVEAQSVLHKVLLNEKHIPDVDRVVFWLSEEYKDFSTYIAALEFDSSDRGPLDLNSFLETGNEEIRDHYFDYLRNVESPSESGWNYRYASTVCLYGGEAHLNQIFQFLDDESHQLGDLPVAAIARILEVDATQDLLKLARNERWADCSIGELSKLHAHSENAEVLQVISDRLNEAGRYGVDKLIESALLIGGDQGRKIAAEHVDKVAIENRRSIVWQINQNTIEELIDTLRKYGIDIEESADHFREQDALSYGSERSDAYLVTSVLNVIMGCFDSEADELPQHEKVLNRLAFHPFGRLGFNLSDIKQDSKLVDEDNWIQSHKVRFRFDGMEYQFEGQTEGDWYDCEGLIETLEKAVSESRKDWELRLSDSRYQDVIFYVAPKALLDELEKTYHIRYRKTEQVDNSLSREDRFLKAILGEN